MAPPRTETRPRTRFELPKELAAARPPEARGLERDGVRLLVCAGTGVEHARFRDLPRYLGPGDLVVVNTSATRAAAVDARLTGRFDAPRGPEVVVHLSTPLDDGAWVVEVRTAPDAGQPIRTLAPGTRLVLPTGLELELLAGHPVEQGPPGPRLWRTRPLPPGRVGSVLARFGRPIRYGYLAGRWPVETYQTVFARPEPRPGARTGDEGASAEMPSAGRPFSDRLVTRMVAGGVQFAPIVLHAGVSSPEAGEPPAPERYRVPARTAALVNWTRRTGGRVIAVGTTVTRALESAAGARGLRAVDGWTDLVLGPDRPVRAVDGLITGLHDPDASHLLLLEAVAGAERVQRVYDAALEQRYLWHEFGDSCLLLG
jgi:S-adenosylmethionine:tRNA ribosyltransferase-isomerase